MNFVGFEVFWGWWYLFMAYKFNFSDIKLLLQWLSAWCTDHCCCM